MKHLGLLIAIRQATVLIQNHFLSLMKVEEEDTQRNCLKRGPDWTLESFHLAIGL